MNTPNPLIPQGTFPDRRGKSHIRITVFTILAVHVAFLGLLLLQACNRKADQTQDTASITNYPPPLPETNLPPPVATNPPAVVTSVAPPPPEPPPSSLAEHVVIKGDTFSTIAKKYNTTAKAIAEANPGVDSTKLKIGQKIKIPAPVASAPASNGTVVGETGARTYAVKSGDTLGKIAKANGVTIAALRSANHLKTDQIRVGQKLTIPSKATGPEAGPSPVPALPAGGTTPLAPPPGNQ